MPGIRSTGKLRIMLREEIIPTDPDLPVNKYLKEVLQQEFVDVDTGINFIWVDVPIVDVD